MSECLGGRTSTFVAQTEHVSFFARVSVTALLRVRERGSSKKRPGQQGGQNTEYNTVQYRRGSTGRTKNRIQYSTIQKRVNREDKIQNTTQYNTEEGQQNTERDNGCKWDNDNTKF